MSKRRNDWVACRQSRGSEQLLWQQPCAPNAHHYIEIAFGSSADEREEKGSICFFGFCTKGKPVFIVTFTNHMAQKFPCQSHEHIDQPDRWHKWPTAIARVHTHPQCNHIDMVGELHVCREFVWRMHHCKLRENRRQIESSPLWCGPSSRQQ